MKVDRAGHQIAVKLNEFRWDRKSLGCHHRCLADAR
jgi:hypothetical protein